MARATKGSSASRVRCASGRSRSSRYLFVPAQGLVARFLETFKEFPPRQKAASFTIDQVMEKMLADAGGAGR